MMGRKRKGKERHTIFQLRWQTISQIPVVVFDAGLQIAEAAVEPADGAIETVELSIQAVELFCCCGEVANNLIVSAC